MPHTQTQAPGPVPAAPQTTLLGFLPLIFIVGFVVFLFVRRKKANRRKQKRDGEIEKWEK